MLIKKRETQVSVLEYGRRTSKIFTSYLSILDGQEETKEKAVYYNYSRP